MSHPPSPSHLIDYSDPRCICRMSGMGRRTDCELHGAKARAQAFLDEVEEPEGDLDDIITAANREQYERVMRGNA